MRPLNSACAKMNVYAIFGWNKHSMKKSTKAKNQRKKNEKGGLYLHVQDINSTDLLAD